MGGHRSHTVKQGEDVVSIAQYYGLSPSEIWNDPENQALKERIKDPYVLKPGDVLMIPPEPPPKSASIATGERHTFRRKGVPEKLILFFHENDEPRAGIPYVLEIAEEKKRHEGETDGEGKIEHWVQPTSRRATLTLSDPAEEEPEVHELRLGYLEPVDTDAGLRARLKNLGFLDDERAGERELAAAVEAFQERHGLKVTGKASAATRAKLLEAHRS